MDSQREPPHLALLVVCGPSWPTSIFGSQHEMHECMGNHCRGEIVGVSRASSASCK